MPNKRLSAMKDIIKRYQATTNTMKERMQLNEKTMKPEYAKEENWKIMESMKSKQEEAKAAIMEEMNAGYREAEAWGKLDGGKITSDAKLLDAGIVTPEQFKELVTRYQDNGTMTQLLADFAERKNKESGGFAALWGVSGSNKPYAHYDTSGLQSVASKQADLKKYAAGAAGIIDQLSDCSKEAPGAEWMNLAINQFGET